MSKNNMGISLGLGAIALIRPLLSILGINVINHAFTSIAATILITLIWIAVAVTKKVDNPVLVLIIAGVSYAVFAILLNTVLSPILLGGFQGAVITRPYGIVSMLITNAIWGLIAGVIALAIMRTRRFIL